MAIVGSRDTQKKLRPISRGPKYTFRITADDRFITISNGKEEKFWSVEALERMRDSTGLPDPVRDMARQALGYFGKNKKRKPEDLVSETIITIEGVKVYQDLKGRNFFAKIAGTIVYRRNLGDLEKIIKNGGL